MSNDDSARARGTLRPAGRGRPVHAPVLRGGEQLRRTPVEPRAGLVGRVLGERFHVTGILGHGGMSSVAEAIDLWTDERAAVKVLMRDASDVQARRRFACEAVAMRALKHPSLVRLLGTGTFDENAGQYLAMELIEGRTLRQAMRRRDYSTPRGAVTLLEPLAEALDVLHRSGLVHRDVKPDNVMVDVAGRPRLIDFGIAFQLDDVADRITDDHLVVGSPAYLAPEAGLGRRPSPSWDVYSLGVLFFELLTGKVPFSGLPADVLREKVARPAPSLVAATGQLYSLDVEIALARALGRDPTKRQATPTELVRQVRDGLIRR